MQCPEILLGTNKMSQGRQDIFLLKVSQDTFKVYVLTMKSPNLIRTKDGYRITYVLVS